jgi:hypothetical protein
MLIDISTLNNGQYIANLLASTADAMYDNATRPSLWLQPSLMQDGPSWIALYGDDLASGVVGCGGTPEAAYRDFDRAWFSCSGTKKQASSAKTNT